MNEDCQPDFKFSAAESKINGDKMEGVNVKDCKIEKNVNCEGRSCLPKIHVNDCEVTLT